MYVYKSLKNADAFLTIRPRSGKDMKEHVKIRASNIAPRNKIEMYLFVVFFILLNIQLISIFRFWISK